jgi:hypothetical protein
MLMNGNEHGVCKKFLLSVTVQLKVIIKRTAEVTMEEAIIELAARKAQKVE